MKWIGQQIYDQVSRFRHDFYLEGIAASTETDMLVVDSAGKVSKRAIDAITVDVSDFLTDGADNRVVTATGTDALLAETYFTFENDSNASTLKLISNENALDYFSITTTTNGLTTFETVDADAQGAAMILKADQNIYFKSIAGSYYYYNNHSNTSDYFQIAVGGDGDTKLSTVDAASAAAHFEIEADGNITLDAAGDIVLEAGSGVFSCDAAGVNFTGTSADRPSVNLTNNANDATGPNLFFRNMRDGNGLEDSDVLGAISFAGEDAGGTAQNSYGSITGSVAEADHGDEAGQIAITVANDGTERNGITMTADKGTATEVDVTIANGAASTTTIAGTLTMGSTAALTNAGLVAVASQPNITTLAGVDSIGTDGDTLAVLADQLLMSNTTASQPIIKLVNTTDNNEGSQIIFEKLRDDDGVASGQNLGEIWFRGQNSAQQSEDYAYIVGEIDVSTDGQESGQLKLGLANHDGGNGSALILTGGSADNEIDATIGLGAASVTTVAGTLTMGSTATLNNTGILQTAAQTNITSLGTLTALTVDNIGINGKTITSSSDLILDVAGDIDIDAGGEEITVDSDVFTFLSGVSNKPIVRIRKTGDDTTAPEFRFQKDKGAAGDDGDDIGVINFVSDDTAQTQTTFARILAEVSESQNVSAAGKLTLSVAESAAGTEGVTVGLSPGLILEGEEGTNNEVDVTIANGSASTTTVAGNLKVTTGIELSHDSDTTIARASAGVVTIESNPIQTTNVHHHFIHAGFFLNYPYSRYIPLNGSIVEQNTATNSPEYVNFTWPYDGFVKTMWLRSETDMGSTNLKLYKGAAGATVTTALGNVTATVGATATVEFDFTSVTNTYSQGDTMAILCDPTEDPDGGQNITIELIFDLTT